MCPCIASIILITSNKMQLFLIYFFLKRSTCFGRFLRPPSGAHNCLHSFRYCRPVLLLAGIVDDMELHEYRGWYGTPWVPSHPRYQPSVSNKFSVGDIPPHRAKQRTQKYYEFAYCAREIDVLVKSVTFISSSKLQTLQTATLTTK